MTPEDELRLAKERAVEIAKRRQTSTPPTTEEIRQYTGNPGTALTRQTDESLSSTRDAQGGWNATPPQTKTSSNSIMNCFQSTPESCGASTNPRGEHHTKKASLHKPAFIGFTTHTYSSKRLALLRLPHTSPHT